MTYHVKPGSPSDVWLVIAVGEHGDEDGLIYLPALEAVVPDMAGCVLHVNGRVIPSSLTAEEVTKLIREVVEVTDQREWGEP